MELSHKALNKVYFINAVESLNSITKILHTYLVLCPQDIIQREKVKLSLCFTN
jgi:hypothetical protein